MNSKSLLHEELEKKLKENYDVAINSIATSGKEGWKYVTFFMEFLKDQIPKFFSQEYLGSEIRKVYGKIKDGSATNSTVLIRDISFAEREYNSYLVGMDCFIGKLENPEGKTPQELMDLLDGVIERSRNFTLELFSDNSNPEKEETVPTAMKDVEVLIDYISTINKLIEYGESGPEKIEKIPSYLRDKAYILYYECIVSYAYLIIAEIYNTFDKIQSALLADDNTNPCQGFCMF